MSIQSKKQKQRIQQVCQMPGVGLMDRVVGLGYEGPKFKSCFAVELIPCGVDSACHPSEVGKMSINLLVSWIVPNSQGDCLSSTNALHRVWSQSPPPIQPDQLS